MNIGEDHTVAVVWTRSGLAVTGEEVTFSAGRGVLTPDTGVSTEEGNGVYSIIINAAQAGKSIIEAIGIDDSVSPNVEISTKATASFIATTPATLTISSEQQVVKPNGDTTFITAKVKDANRNVVEKAAIIFTIVDPSGGGLSDLNAETNEQGEATVIYTSVSSSDQDQVKITATVVGTSISSTTELTVTERANSIIIGSNNELVEDGDATTYSKDYVVIVTDESGNPVSGQKIDKISTPVNYRRGFWVWNEGDSAYNETNLAADNTTVIPVRTCASEDTNLDGDLADSEDWDSNGTLSPGDIASFSFVNTNITDDEGKVHIRLTYPIDYANWVVYSLEASVFADGTESSSKITNVLPVAADDLSNENVPPTSSSWGRGECPTAP